MTDVPTWLIVWLSVLSVGVAVALWIALTAWAGNPIERGTTHKGFGR